MSDDLQARLYATGNGGRLDRTTVSKGNAVKSSGGALRFSHPLLVDTDLARPIVPSNEDRFDAPLSSRVSSSSFMQISCTPRTQ
jgi:hypothetical protein